MVCEYLLASLRESEKYLENFPASLRKGLYLSTQPAVKHWLLGFCGGGKRLFRNEATVAVAVGSQRSSVVCCGGVEHFGVLFLLYFRVQM